MKARSRREGHMHDGDKELHSKYNHITVPTCILSGAPVPAY